MKLWKAIVFTIKRDFNKEISLSFKDRSEKMNAVLSSYNQLKQYDNGNYIPINEYAKKQHIRSEI